jgi:hypothetical protein
MHSIDHRVTIAGVIALVGTALVMTHGMGGNGSRSTKFYPANASISEPMPVATMASTVSAAPGEVGGVRAVGSETVIAGSEPDPEAFDQAVLELWWAKYQKAHPAR